VKSIYYPKSFQYYSPNNVEEALELLDKLSGEAKLLAGGQSLLLLMKLRIFSPKYIIDLNKLSSILSYIKEEDEYIRIGALTTHNDIAENFLISQKVTALSEAASTIADYAVRNVGTLGGSISHADPAANYPPALLVLDSIVKVRSINSEREIKFNDFIKGPFETALNPNEMVVEVKVRKHSPNTTSTFIKKELSKGDFGIVNIAVKLGLEEDRCREIKIAVGGINPKPVRLVEAEKVLEGKVINDENINKLGEVAASEVKPQSDIRASAEYRRQLIRVYTRRAVKICYERLIKK